MRIEFGKEGIFIFSERMCERLEEIRNFGWLIYNQLEIKDRLTDLAHILLEGIFWA